MKLGKLLVCLCALALPAFAGVTVNSPSNGASVSSPVHFVASASSPSCSKGVSAIGVYTAPGVLAKVVNGTSLDAYISMNSGTQYPVVQEWDNCGWSAKVQLTVNVGGTPVNNGSGGGKTFYNLQHGSGWNGYALLPPNFPICSTCTSTGSNVSWSWVQNVSSPSMDGMSTKSSYNGGTTQWADILWNNHLIGDFSSQGLPDFSKTLVPSLHNFTYDVYFWIGNTSNSQALEFDINQFVNGHSLIFGTQCNVRAGNRWDVWDNVNSRWVGTGKYCGAPSAWTWHHVVIEVERATDGGDWLHYISIEMDGNKTYLDTWYAPTGTSWKGITVNFQMDGNYAMQPYTVWLDKFNLLTW